MEKTPDPGPQLTPSPRALQRALNQSAQMAHRLAQAFGQTVPAEKPKTQSSKRPTSKSAKPLAH